jgi:hypothetical protein
MAVKRQQDGADSAPVADLPKNQPDKPRVAAKKPQPSCRNAEHPSKLWELRRLSTILRLMESSRLGR